MAFWGLLDKDNIKEHKHYWNKEELLILGSSTGFSRMIRLAYHEHPDYVPLLRRAYERWTQLEAKTQQKLLFN